MRENRLNWFSHLQQRPLNSPIRRIHKITINGARRTRGRPIRVWLKTIEKDMLMINSKDEIFLNRTQKFGIKVLLLLLVMILNISPRIIMWYMLYTNLNMSKLGDLNSRVGDWNWTASFQPMKEPLFDWVIVQGTIYIHWPYWSPIHALWAQQAFCLELSFVSALWINCIGLKNNTQKGRGWGVGRN